MERTLIAQVPISPPSSSCPIGNLDSDFKCRANQITPSIGSPTVYPNISVPMSGTVATPPNYMGDMYYGKLQEGFVQSVVIALVYLGFSLVFNFLKSIKK